MIKDISYVYEDGKRKKLAELTGVTKLALIKQLWKELVAAREALAGAREALDSTNEPPTNCVPKNGSWAQRNYTSGWRQRGNAIRAARLPDEREGPT